MWSFRNLKQIPRFNHPVYSTKLNSMVRGEVEHLVNVDVSRSFVASNGYGHA